jgi:hypothetical protein
MSNAALTSSGRCAHLRSMTWARRCGPRRGPRSPSVQRTSTLIATGVAAGRLGAAITMFSPLTAWEPCAEAAAQRPLYTAWCHRADQAPTWRRRSSPTSAAAPLRPLPRLLRPSRLCLVTLLMCGMLRSALLALCTAHCAPRFGLIQVCKSLSLSYRLAFHILPACLSTQRGCSSRRQPVPRNCRRSAAFPIAPCRQHLLGHCWHRRGVNEHSDDATIAVRAAFNADGRLGGALVLKHPQTPPRKCIKQPAYSPASLYFTWKATMESHECALKTSCSSIPT